MTYPTQISNMFTTLKEQLEKKDPNQASRARFIYNIVKKDTAQITVFMLPRSSPSNNPI